LYCSSNGTFLNGDKIGRNKTQVLNNNDEIALAHKKNKVYIFHDPSGVNSVSIPEEMKEKYSISKTLGRGACGEVKLAFKKGTCEKFAVKVIVKKKFSIGPRVGPAIMEEVKILKQLQHPCVIGIEDVYDSVEALYIVLEL
jgi:serine/threonine-protein kinase Chk2